VIEIRQITDDDDMAAAYAIRAEVFIDEQDVTLEEEVDGMDDLALHVLLLVDGAPVGTGRAIPPHGPGSAGGSYHLGRIAVRMPWRGRGLGVVVVRALEDLCARHASARGGCGQVELDLEAQTHALGFYRRLGYTVCRREFLDARIAHRQAVRWVRRVGG